MKVFTTHGLIDYERLSIKDVVELGDNHRKVSTEFYLGDELVRRDVAVSMLRPVDIAADQGKMNG